MAAGRSAEMLGLQIEATIFLASVTDLQHYLSHIEGASRIPFNPGIFSHGRCPARTPSTLLWYVQDCATVGSMNRPKANHRETLPTARVLTLPSFEGSRPPGNIASGSVSRKWACPHTAVATTRKRRVMALNVEIISVSRARMFSTSSAVSAASSSLAASSP